MADMNVSISPELIKPIIESKIQAAIVETLGRSPQVIESAVTAILMMRVDSRGNPSNSSYDKDTFLSRLCDEEIKNATRSALVEHLENSRPQIVTALKKAISKNTDKMAVAMVEGLIGQAGNGYRFAIEVKNEKRMGE